MQSSTRSPTRATGEQVNSPCLDGILAESWSHLERGVRQASEPFHLGVFGSWNGRECSMRTVVLRGANRERRELVCHTDYRSPKREQVSKHPRVSWLFYDASRKLQLRLVGQAQVVCDGNDADARWARTSLSARRCYLGEFAPGTLASAATSGLPPALEARSPTEAESARGRPNFAVAVTLVDELEWLQLEARGHRRARFRWHNGELSAEWLVP